MAKHTPSQPRPENPLGDLVIGLLALAAAVYFYFDLSEFESQGGERKLNAIFALLFNGFGKWGVVVPFLGIGVASVWSFTRKRKQQQG
jgi:hypothetical protein